MFFLDRGLLRRKPADEAAALRVVRIGSRGFGLWLPQIMKQFGLSPSEVGFVASLPYVCGAIAMVLWARMSDRGKDRTVYPAISLFVGAAGLVVSTTDTSPAATIVALCAAVAGINSYTATFWEDSGPAWPRPEALL
jgi:ACS family tartrate transporter-like MFS transporter